MKQDRTNVEHQNRLHFMMKWRVVMCRLQGKAEGNAKHECLSRLTTARVTEGGPSAQEILKKYQ